MQVVENRSKAIENLLTAQRSALSVCPKIGGFPYFAEVLRSAGIYRNIWNLPSCESIYCTKYGPVAIQGSPLVSSAVDIPPFNQEALIKALRRDQAGESTFAEFLKAAWEAGVVRYIVDFEKRLVVYYGISDESYSEKYRNIHEEPNGSSCI